MLLVHARALATEAVIRNGTTYPKDGPFTDDQFTYEDWEPIRVVYQSESMPATDCGCGDVDEQVSPEVVSPEGE